MADRAAGRSTAAPSAKLRPAHCAVLALVVWALVWSIHLAVLDLPANRPVGLAAAADSRARRARRAHAGLVMDDGTVVPVKRSTRPEVVLPDRTALLAERQLTLVLLASADDEEGFPRLESCAEALSAFASPPSIAELLVVAPTAQHATFEAHATLRRLPFAWRVVDDAALLSQSASYFQRYTPRREWRERGGRGVAYRLQMLLKLAAAAVVSTEFYVTLDQDVLLAQPLAFASLVSPDGKALVQGEAWPYARRHDISWWAAADRALRAGGCVLHAGTEGAGWERALRGATIGVTPAVLSRSIALRTMARIEEANGGRWWGAAWDEILFRLLLQAPDQYNWSEYTLYWTAGCEWRAADGTSALERLHAPPARGAKSIYDETGFEWGDWEAWRPEAVFGKDAPALFAVLQSNSGVNAG
ncbi:hypothetical protein KFE25_007716 [Diacronema lutheri]|uniref:Uncharacterized protein n=3 Tax=Diacronema lutheri TaxID=2081491 RepID=A0A8J5XPN4_DIALT|nr:hypothetical protein KFE25_007716 [Diacronema lutheri]